ncbi:MAG: helix-turn-helix domain-containing protein [Luteitalea sp.]|nr:helix-turn-helix domain-containing protein [Luteitalea sp.]
MPRAKRRVALIYDARLVYDVKVMTGVAAYLQERGHYSVYVEENALKDQRLPDLRSWKGDGIIADFDDPAVARLVGQSRLPTVGFGGGYGWYVEGSSTPYFFTNNQAIATLAIDHLLERGFKHFAYCGYARTPINGWSEEREHAFVKLVTKRRCSCAVFHGHHKSTRQWAAVQQALGEWLRRLPKPVGVMAANDNRGRQVLEACRAYDLNVPNEVTVIGVDNDELLCQLSSPPLSSIEQGARRLGYAAAALLDSLMRGRKPQQCRVIIDPVGVVTRQSTDVLAVEDSDVARALAYIREHACDGIKVPRVVSAVGISRSGLEKRFASVLGNTIRTAIRRTQLERARRLVSETDMPLKQVAAETGFKSVQHLTTVFAHAFAKTPARYRQTTTR